MKGFVDLVVPKLVSYLISFIPPNKLVMFADKLLDWCENAVEKSENKLDNELILPLINIVREAFNIEDNDVVVQKK